MRMSHREGFTIIEIVLVLAIVGLIFLMVFVALPALQRSQRDAQRKRDMSLFVNAWTRRYSNMVRGLEYTSVTQKFENLFSSGYIKNNEFIDPSTGESYSVLVAGGIEAYSEDSRRALEVGQIILDFSVLGCDGDRILDAPTNNDSNSLQTIGVVTRLENGGLICVSNV